MTAYGATPDLNEATCQEAASWYLEHKFRPIPWEVKGDRKVVSLHAFNYQQYVSSPPEKVQELLDLWRPEWQVGLALAEPGGVFAVDIDKWEQLHEFEGKHGEIPRENDTWWQATGRDDGGAHALFQRGHLLNEWPGHGHFSRHYPLLEIKSNGFIAVPPSTHPSGNKYQWIGKSSGISGVPHLLAAFLNERQAKRSWVTPVDGSGGDTATGISSAELVRNGIPDGVPQDNALRDLVWDMVQQGLPDAFIEATWWSVTGKSALLKPDKPWTDKDFARHLHGAREKLGGGMSAAELAWARRTGVSPRPDGSNDVTDRDPSAPAPPDGIPIDMADGARVPDIRHPVAVGDTGAFTHLRNDPEANIWLSERMLRQTNDGNLDLIATGAHLPYSDLASAQLLAHVYPGLYSFSTQDRRWRFWDGVIHRPAHDGDVANIIVRYCEAYRIALARIKAQVMAAGAAASEPVETTVTNYEQRWKNHRRYRDLLWDQPRQGLLMRQMENTIFAISESRFDREPDIAVCENGVLTLSTVGVSLLPHCCDRLVTKRLGNSIEWDPDAKALTFDHFLSTSIKTEDQRLWLQMALGMAMFGRPLKGFVNFIGRNDTGKSTLSRIMHTVFGTYATSIGIDAFLEGSSGNNEFRVHELKGMRLALAAEPAPGRKIDSEAIKTVTGQDMMKTRMPYSQYTEWFPQVLIVISSNHPMRLDTSDVAMMKRLRPVEFTHPEAIDPTLERRIRATELPGVLRWLVEGAEKAVRMGEEKSTEPTETMLKLRERMAEQVDEVLQFVNDSLEAGWLKKVESNGSGRLWKDYVTVGDLYTRYVTYSAMEGNIHTVGKRTFSSRLDRLYPVINSGGKRFKGLIIE